MILEYKVNENDVQAAWLKTLYDLIDELNQNMTHIENLVNSINGDWQGDAEKAYVSKILGIKEFYSRINSFLCLYANCLIDQATAYYEHEQEIYKKISLM